VSKEGIDALSKTITTTDVPPRLADVRERFSLGKPADSADGEFLHQRKMGETLPPRHAPVKPHVYADALDSNDFPPPGDAQQSYVWPAASDDRRLSVPALTPRRIASRRRKTIARHTLRTKDPSEAKLRYPPGGHGRPRVGPIGPRRCCQAYLPALVEPKPPNLPAAAGRRWKLISGGKDWAAP
jgi:hypothetical protein